MHKWRVNHSLPFSRYSAPGGLRQDPGDAAESLDPLSHLRSEPLRIPWPTACSTFPSASPTRPIGADRIRRTALRGHRRQPLRTIADLSPAVMPNGRRTAAPAGTRWTATWKSSSRRAPAGIESIRIGPVPRPHGGRRQLLSRSTSGDSGSPTAPVRHCSSTGAPPPPNRFSEPPTPTRWVW